MDPEAALLPNHHPRCQRAAMKNIDSCNTFTFPPPRQPLRFLNENAQRRFGRVVENLNDSNLNVKVYTEIEIYTRFIPFSA